MRRNNPYTLIFGKEPSQMISRFIQSDEICRTFLDEDPSQQIYMITGVRGSGKTVLMTEIAKRIQKEDNWVVLELNPANDLLQGLAAKLYNNRKLTPFFKKAKIDLSFFGIGVEIDREDPITDLETAIERMLETLKKHNKRVLITIDEIVSTKETRVFSSAFQIFVRRDLPVYLLMTGLYDNIEALQNDKILTFLHRAPKIRLKPLNLGSVSATYKKTFDLDDAGAREMARLTRGYPFAFQVLGYFTYENNGSYLAAQQQSRQYLDEYVYDIIWTELSPKDRLVAKTIVESGTGKIREIREELQMSSGEFSPYRDRLIRKGIVDGDEHGYLKFTLPFFEDYVLDHA